MGAVMEKIFNSDVPFSVSAYLLGGLADSLPKNVSQPHADIE